MKALLAFSLPVIFLSPTMTMGQATGRVTGSVADPTGAFVPNATVSLQLPDTSADVFATRTTVDGQFTLASVNPGIYSLVVEARGFTKVVIHGLAVDPGRSTDVPPITFELAGVQQTVNVTDAVTSVQTSTAEVTTIISSAQIQSLPVLDRSPLGFLQTQPGVTYNGRGVATTINGQRPSFTNVTLDGINIQDNFIRSNALDFLPNLLLLDQVVEVSLTTSNTSAAVYGGSAQVAFVTPSGGNQYHGSLYWQNRNSALSANNWFNNQAGVGLPFLNQNQLGGAVGGRIIRNKLFFYSNYEALRLHQQTGQNNIILTQDARDGIYTYRDSSGAIKKVNILQAMGVQPDPLMQTILTQVPTPDKINNFNTGDSTSALLRNTAGYQFLRRNNRTRDNATFKSDYILSTRHTFTVSYLWNRDVQDRPGTSTDTTFSLIPSVQNHDASKLLSGAWRWSPQATLTNEARFGFNLAPVIFLAGQDIPKFFVTGESYTNPVNTVRTQGRNTNTYNFADNASWVHGTHTVQFGHQSQRIRIEQFNDGGITPTYTLGIGTKNPGLTAVQLPGAAANDVTAANTLLATLAGLYTSSSQTFNVNSRTSGYVPGADLLRHDIYDDYAFYAQDTWKAMRRLTVNAGLRWDYYTPVTERDGLALFPLLQNNNPIQTLLSNATLDFSGPGTGRSWYKSDRNNFAPNIGLAWDVTGRGKTVLRAGYSIAFVNDSAVKAADNSQVTNAGLVSTVGQSGLSGRVGQGVVPVPAPVFKVPRTFADNYALTPTNAEALIDPNLVTPYVQQWSAGVQHEYRNTVFEVRYIGNHGTKQIRGFDLNQVLIGAFLPDFQKAQSNGFLAQKATGVFDPRYNSNLAGSQPLPFFNQLTSAGLLTNATIINLIQTGQVGELANTYQVNGLNGPVNFYQNPLGQGMNFVTNISNSSYNGLQIDVNHRFARGLQFQANYTFSKVLSDAQGNNINDFEPFLDLHNPKLDRSRPSDFDVTQVFKVNASYNLPFGPGHRLDSRHPVLRRVIEGWTLSGIFDAQTGNPFSILAQAGATTGRGTLNRQARSNGNTATTALTGSQLSDIVQFRMTGNGPYFVAASAIGPDGRGVAPDGAASFNGQVFFNPAAGTVGTLQRNFFSGPSLWSMDSSLIKRIRLTERQSLALRMDAANVFNHPTFYVPDQNINSSTFGKIGATTTALTSPRRLLQLGAAYTF